MKLTDLSISDNMRVMAGFISREDFDVGKPEVTTPYRDVYFEKLKKIHGRDSEILHIEVNTNIITITLENPPVDWSKVPVDTKVLVRDYETSLWTRRYFSGYINGEYYVFRDGKTSWNATNGQASYTYCKLWEEGKDE